MLSETSVIKGIVSIAKSIVAKMFALSTSFWGWVVLVSCQFFMIEGVETGIWALGFLYIIDFGTGVNASWVERKEKKLKAQKDLPPYFIESDKLKRSVAKIVFYSLLILLSFVLYVTVFNGVTNLPLSEKEFTIVNIAIGLCMAIEIWSILENFKRSGFDLIGKLMNVFRNFWKVADTVRGRGNHYDE